MFILEIGVSQVARTLARTVTEYPQFVSTQAKPSQAPLTPGALQTQPTPGLLPSAPAQQAAPALGPMVIEIGKQTHKINNAPFAVQLDGMNYTINRAFVRGNVVGHTLIPSAPIPNVPQVNRTEIITIDGIGYQILTEQDGRSGAVRHQLLRLPPPPPDAI